MWYNYLDPDKTVEIVNDLKNRAESGQQIFYSIYSEEEIAKDSRLADTGLFFFKGTPGEKFAVINAGGGFVYVGAMHDSFPHALELSKMGCNAFALIYRPNYAYDDLARAIAFITQNADTLEVDPEGFSLWGGSAGARMAAALGNADNAKAYGIPQASTVIMQYTGYSSASRSDAPTYANVGTSDGIASWKTMQSRLKTLESYGIPTEFHSFEGLPHSSDKSCRSKPDSRTYHPATAGFADRRGTTGHIPRPRERRFQTVRNLGYSCSVVFAL